MDEITISSLMIWCGALHDIAEKSKETWTKKQIIDVHNNIAKLINPSNSEEYQLSNELPEIYIYVLKNDSTNVKP